MVFYMMKIEHKGHVDKKKDATLKTRKKYIIF